MTDKNKPKRRVFESPHPFSGRQFSGVLLEPIWVPYSPDLTGNDVELDARIDAIRQKIAQVLMEHRVKRIGALLEHYGIPPGSWEQAFFRLTLKLAEDFVPGFQINVEPPLKTRPRGSYTVGGEGLFRAIEKRRNEKGGTVLEACRHLSRSRTRWHGHSPKALEAAYHRFANQVEAATAYFEEDPIFAELIDTLGFERLLQEIVKPPD